MSLPRHSPAGISVSEFSAFGRIGGYGTEFLGSREVLELAMFVALWAAPRSLDATYWLVCAEFGETAPPTEAILSETIAALQARDFIIPARLPGEASREGEGVLLTEKGRAYARRLAGLPRALICPGMRRLADELTGRLDANFAAEDRAPPI